MRIYKRKKNSIVHGRIIRTYIVSEGESDKEVHYKLRDLMAGTGAIGLSFMGSHAHFDVKRKWWQL